MFKMNNEHLLFRKHSLSMADYSVQVRQEIDGIKMAVLGVAMKVLNREVALVRSVPSSAGLLSWFRSSLYLVSLAKCSADGNCTMEEF